MALVPLDRRGRLAPAELFHQLLEHRWYLSEQAGHEVDLFETAHDFIDTQLPGRPEEAVATDPDA